MHYGENQLENDGDRIRTPVNYCISPINPEESDADLSDFAVSLKRLNSNIFFYLTLLIDLNRKGTV